MKKIILATLLLFILFTNPLSCDSSINSSQTESETIDRTFWWSSKEDDPGLRKRFEELNAKYFEGDLKVKYIRYGDGLIYEDLSAITCYWNRTSNSENAGESVITVDRKFIEENPNELDGVLLHEMCHVFANMHDKGAEVDGADGHQLETYKMAIKYLVAIGANPRLGEGIVKF